MTHCLFTVRSENLEQGVRFYLFTIALSVSVHHDQQKFPKDLCVNKNAYRNDQWNK